MAALPGTLRGAVPLLVALVALAACGRGGDEGAAVRMDTANASWEDGLSAEQVQGEARAMTPEEAEAAGLAVDTTIHLEVRTEDDTVALPRNGRPTPPPVDPAEHDTIPAPRR